MAHRVCPWWIGYLLANPLRRWLGQDPAKILSPYVREGMTVLEPGVDFTLAFAMVHEFPDAKYFFAEVARASKQNARVLLAEPRGHVRDDAFAAELAAAAATGLSIGERPAIKRSQAALLFKK